MAGVFIKTIAKERVSLTAHFMRELEADHRAVDEAG
jgi:hypothetical protein